MERYVFFDPTRIPPGLHVMGIPTAEGLVWMKSPQQSTMPQSCPPRLPVSWSRTPGEVLARRLPRPAAENEETVKEGSHDPGRHRAQDLPTLSLQPSPAVQLVVCPADTDPLRTRLARSTDACIFFTAGSRRSTVRT